MLIQKKNLSLLSALFGSAAVYFIVIFIGNRTIVNFKMYDVEDYWMYQISALELMINSIVYVTLAFLFFLLIKWLIQKIKNTEVRSIVLIAIFSYIVFYMLVPLFFALGHTFNTFFSLGLIASVCSGLTAGFIIDRK